MTKSSRFECALPPFKRTDCLSVQDVSQLSGWSITAFDLPKTWQRTQGEGVVIAVLDTGCQLDHVDLQANLLEGINFVERGKPPYDKLGHGSHICGIIAAENNDIGIVGVAPKVKIRPVKVLNNDGNGNLLNVIEGIRWAADMKCDFISMSLGAPVQVQQVRKAIQYAASKGSIVFCAAGNAGSGNLFYPAYYPETISVGAVDMKLRKAKFSNFGDGLDFMAPGVDILSTVPTNWYAKMSGTSMAQPFCCAVAALLLSYKRKAKLNIKLDDNVDYINLLKNFTTPVAGGRYDNPEFYTGFGIIDPSKFVNSFT